MQDDHTHPFVGPRRIPDWFLRFRGTDSKATKKAPNPVTIVDCYISVCLRNDVKLALKTIAEQLELEESTTKLISSRYLRVCDATLHAMASLLACACVCLPVVGGMIHEKSTGSSVER